MLSLHTVGVFGLLSMKHIQSVYHDERLKSSLGVGTYVDAQAVCDRFCKGFFAKKQE
jgi:hypothetical protein